MYSNKRQSLSITSENGNIKVKYRTKIQYFNPTRQSGRKDLTDVIHALVLRNHQKEIGALVLPAPRL